MINEIKQDFKKHEEKHKQIEEIVKEIAECNKESCQDCKLICTYCYAIKRFCELFLPEDEIILSREEFEKGKQDYNYQIHRALVAEGRVDKASKKTAEKYHKAMRKVIHERDYIEGYAEIGLQEENDEIAKQFGVEIKE